MVQTKGHLTFSIFLGGSYALLGVYGLGFLPEHAILAMLLVLIFGMLPDIDSSGSNVAKEFGACLAAVAPIVILEYFPELRVGGLSRIALVVIACYLATRIITMQGLHQITKQQGMIHSVPAAIIVFELSYLFFYDLFWQDRLFLAVAAFLGYMGHLFLDATSNFDIAGTAFGGGKKGRPVLKLVGENWLANVVVYCCLMFFGYHVFLDISPHLEASQISALMRN